MTLSNIYEPNPDLDLLLERVVDVPRARLDDVDPTRAAQAVVHALAVYDNRV